MTSALGAVGANAASLSLRGTLQAIVTPSVPTR